VVSACMQGKSSDGSGRRAYRYRHERPRRLPRRR
jgi:hypothetical protein